MVAEFHYQLPWRARGHLPGHHLGSQGGAGFEFRGHAPLLSAPDPRRLDIRASLRDPFGNWMVRVFNQRSAVPVIALADLSASMGFHHKMATLADFTAALGFSSWRTGDPFGFIGCDEAVRRDFLHPASRMRGAGADLSRRLRQLVPEGRHSQGMLKAVELLPHRRSLVFLVSDFHFPLAMARELAQRLARHDVVPLVIWDPAEYRHLPRFGLATLRDPETGETRTLLLRRRLRERIVEGFRQRRAELVDLFAPRGRPPLFLEHGFDAELLTRYFYGERTEPSLHAA